MTRLADAILIPPFPGSSAPRWILEALGRGLAGVTLFGQNISTPDQVTALTGAPAASTFGTRSVIVIRIAATRPWPSGRGGNAASPPPKCQC